MTDTPLMPAALYLRSSKDRSDVSIEAQRHALAPFAAELGYTIVAEFSDVVESGKDDDRPGFLRMQDELRSRDRLWQAILTLDTSRVARRRYIALDFEENQCRRHGVRLVYKSLSGCDPESEIILKATLQGVDEWHSRVSRRKALAGMAANVRRGFRAGGRAPIGYKLEYVDTGVVREGRPVLKSRLVLEPSTAPLIGAYMKLRAAGTRRGKALKTAGLNVAESSLVGVEWNALTYAGHTVWNRHSEFERGGYNGGTKRRPRAEWTVQRDTHAAMLTDEEAERILAGLEDYNKRRPRRTSADYLLTGLLKTSDGKPWYGDQGGRYYRSGSRYLSTQAIDSGILLKVTGDLRSRTFARLMHGKLKHHTEGEYASEATRLKAAAAATAARISRFMDMAEQLESRGPVIRKIEELEQERKRLTRRVDELQAEARAARAAGAITEVQVTEILDALAADMTTFSRERLKEFLSTILERITLNPDGLSARIHYKIPLNSRNRVASPRVEKSIPTAKLSTSVRFKRAA
jgi:site-specific DNA recombinase